MAFAMQVRSAILSPTFADGLGHADHVAAGYSE